jgi:hypothetical protein
VAGAAAAIVSGYQTTLLGAASVALAGLVIREVAVARRLEAVAYVLAGLALGSLFVFCLGWRLVRSVRIAVPRRICERLLRSAGDFPAGALRNLSTLRTPWILA